MRIHGLTDLGRLKLDRFFAGLSLLVLLCGVAVEPAGATFDVLVSGFYSGEVLRYDSEGGGLIDVFASGYPPLHSPCDLAFGPDGNLYICDGLSGDILRYDGETGALIDTFGDASVWGGANELEFGPDAQLYAADWDGDRVLRFDGVTGDFIDVFASGGGLDHVTDFKFGPDGDLYLGQVMFPADGDSLKRFDGQTGQYVDTIALGRPLQGIAGFTFIPEPMTICLVALGGLWVTRRR